MASISQNVHRDALPEFRNLGVVLRIVVIVAAMTLAAAALEAGSWQAFWQALVRISMVVQPVLVLSLLALAAVSRWLARLSYHAGIAVAVALVLSMSTAVYRLGGDLIGADPQGDLARQWLFAAGASALILGYFHLRSRALSPALTEARLQALQARIRPHFLFNSINAVLSLIRADARRAEEALEDMADLFRVLMADNRELCPLAREVELTRQYLSLEELRLGERLRVEWHTDKMPADALVPPLVLQPLVENAVYHGIEPSSEPGTISINLYKVRDEVHMVLRNPYRRDGNHHAGNKMALANIKERLALHFDVEASLKSAIADHAYQVHIVMPYVKEAA